MVERRPILPERKLTGTDEIICQWQLLFLGWVGMCISWLLTQRLCVPWGGGCKGGARGKPRPCLSSGRKEQFWQQNLQCGAAFAASGHSHLLWLAAVSAMQNIFICRYFSALLAWPTEYLSSGLIPGFLQGFKRNCYWLNSGVIYNGNPVSHSSCPPRKSWALNLNLGESEAQFALFSFQDIGLFCEELKVPLKIKVSCVPMSWPI